MMSSLKSASPYKISAFYRLLISNPELKKRYVEVRPRTPKDIPINAFIKACSKCKQQFFPFQPALYGQIRQNLLFSQQQKALTSYRASLLYEIEMQKTHTFWEGSTPQKKRVTSIKLCFCFFR